MSQLELYISKSHFWACGAIIFWGLGKPLRCKIFRVVARALAVQLLWLALPISAYQCAQRWSPRGRRWPRGHILKSLALASKVKSLALASRPQVLENWPVLGSRTALFSGMLKFRGALEKFFGKRVLMEIAWKMFVKTFFFFFGDRQKNFCEDLFFYFYFGEHLRFVSLVVGLGLEHSCPWPRECLSSERLSLALASDFFCVLGLEPCVLDSTSECASYERWQTLL